MDRTHHPGLPARVLTRKEITARTEPCPFCGAAGTEPPSLIFGIMSIVSDELFLALAYATGAPTSSSVPSAKATKAAPKKAADGT